MTPKMSTHTLATQPYLRATLGRVKRSSCDPVTSSNTRAIDSNDGISGLFRYPPDDVEGTFVQQPDGSLYVSWTNWKRSTTGESCAWPDGVARGHYMVFSEEGTHEIHHWVMPAAGPCQTDPDQDQPVEVAGLSGAETASKG